jgi:hypothetical protein
VYRLLEREEIEHSCNTVSALHVPYYVLE